MYISLSQPTLNTDASNRLKCCPYQMHSNKKKLFVLICSIISSMAIYFVKWRLFCLKNLFFFYTAEQKEDSCFKEKKSLYLREQFRKGWLFLMLLIRCKGLYNTLIGFERNLSLILHTPLPASLRLNPEWGKVCVKSRHLRASREKQSEVLFK